MKRYDLSTRYTQAELGTVEDPLGSTILARYVPTADVQEKQLLLSPIGNPLRTQTLPDKPSGGTKVFETS